ncbi:MAG: cobalamin B12-binding domain-containing protein [candidate division Zixibacteria bacterium]|nr:cobalamin B12-binding domain-containing protein [candidate division Zixibacteria bacterium]
MPEGFVEIQMALLDAIERADRTSAQAMLRTWAAAHGPERLLAEVIEPVLAWIGEGWRRHESFTIAQGYIAAKVIEDALDQIITPSQLRSSENATGRPAVIGNIEGDFHSLGRRMVGIFLRANGWNVHDLGNDVPGSLFVETALQTGARVIGVSAMTLTTAHEIRKLRSEIDNRKLAGRLKLAVGGAVFVVCPDIVDQVGGDGTAASALHAPRLFDVLWEASVSAARPAGLSAAQGVLL